MASRGDEPSSSLPLLSLYISKDSEQNQEGNFERDEYLLLFTMGDKP